jgi:hypothetical protein
MRSLSRSGIDPPFLCASRETLCTLLACLVERAPAALAEEGMRNHG